MRRQSQPKQQQPPLQRLAQQQKDRDLHPLIAQTERDTRAAFAAVRAELAPLLAECSRAYLAESERLNADRDEDEEPDVRRVPPHWLITSGWQKRIEAATRTAVATAAQRCADRLTHAHAQAAFLGQEHARALMQLAMKPAVKAIVHRRGRHG